MRAAESLTVSEAAAVAPLASAISPSAFVNAAAPDSLVSAKTELPASTEPNRSLSASSAPPESEFKAVNSDLRSEMFFVSLSIFCFVASFVDSAVVSPNSFCFCFAICSCAV